MVSKIFSSTDLIAECQTQKIIIYGAGYVAHRFYSALEKLGLSKNVLCFCTTDISCSETMPKPVYSLFELLKKGLIEDALICVAVHESIKDTIIENLDKKNLHNVVWIYPFLFELFFGNPIECSVKKKTKILLEASLAYSYCEVRNFLALECYYGKNSNGFDIYIKAVSLYCGKTTAEKRAEQFKNLIDSVASTGLKADKKIKICQNNVVLDGAHRCTLAAYFRMKELCCDVFSDSVMSVPTKEAWLTEDVLKANFDDKTVALFKETKERLLEEYC